MYVVLNKKISKFITRSKNKPQEFTTFQGDEFLSFSGCSSECFSLTAF